MSHSTHQHQHRAPAPSAPARNGLGIAALVLGIIGAVSGLIPLFFWLAGILGVIALILGLAGRGRVKRGEATNRGVTTAGAVLGLLSLVLAGVGAYITFKAVDDAANEIDKVLNSAAPQTPSGGGGKSGQDKPKDAKDSAAALKPGATHTYADGLKITVSAPTAFTPTENALDHTKGNKAYQVTVTIENGGSKEFLADGVTLQGRAGEGGVDAPQIYDDGLDGFSGTILAGKKATAKYAFDAPADAKTLTVEVSALDFEHDSKQWELKL